MSPADQLEKMYVVQNMHLEELERLVDAIAVEDGIAPGIEELENARIKLIEYQLWLVRAKMIMGLTLADQPVTL